MQNIIQCLLDDYKIKEIMSFNKDNYEISLYLIFIYC